MAKILVTGSDGQLGQCFKLVANEFPKHKLLLSNRAELDINDSKALSGKYKEASFDLILCGTCHGLL